MSNKNELIYGIHSIKAVLKKVPDRLLEVFILKGNYSIRISNLLDEIKIYSISIQKMNRRSLDAKVGNTKHQGIVARIKKTKEFHENDLFFILSKHKHPLILVLDGITDPHNLGACLRNADAAGVPLVIVPKDRTSPITATVKKVACGAAETVGLVRVVNLARTIRLLQNQGFFFVGTDSNAKRDIYHTKLTGSVAIVVGGEEKGIRHLIRVTCNDLVKIPTVGNITSLNVSVASGICLFEALRQRLV
ncbi:23S rRNA (guanosine(2251)-2'-O)-methyltransferase RlmB [Candidatus Photodesmus anomalopis]|uniref:23S rRNA (guanosine(2251)-2'-O)-methyltransferase RlmB n=1 Tax=Candidatus Photodesmus anomalopis TaxID=28176 RepID=UPI001F51BB5B|nr:23S rRNA (guanosine(2251)-2'-O)-methyltransferase RlmB [Candidatus Photodesmus katoptron]